MSRTVPANSLMAMLAAETGENYIALLSITHDGGVLRITSDSVGTTYGGNPYVVFPFDIILPTNEMGKVVDMQVTLDNVDRGLIEQIRSQATPMSVSLVIVASSDVATSTPTATFSDFSLRSVEYNALQITGRITLEDFLSEPYPNGTFDQGHYPGLFVQGGTYDGEYDYEPPAPSGCTDFGEYILGAIPEGWVLTEGSVGDATAAADSGQYNYTPQDNWLVLLDSAEVVWPGTDVDADVEVLVEFDYVAQDEYAPTILLRAKEGTDAVAYSKRFALMYKDVPLGTSLFQWHYRTADGAYTAIGTSLDKSLGSTGRTFIRASIEGSALKASIWQGNQVDEPSAWDIEETEVSISNAGVFGLWNQETTTQGISRIAHAFEGDSATFGCIYDEFVAGYCTNFSEYPDPVAQDTPDGWTKLSTLAGIWITSTSGEGGQSLEGGSDLDAEIARGVWTDTPSSSECEVLAEYNHIESHGGGLMYGSYIRWNTSVSRGHYAALYMVGGTPVGRLKYSHLDTQLGSDVTGLGLSEFDDVLIRVRSESGVIKAKWWKVGDTEPDWQISENEYSGSPAGVPGVIGWKFYADKMAVAYGGETAGFGCSEGNPFYP